jgi:8-oxo-dGTP pyrophosphatase MutT (NUDIX family)
MTKNYGRNREKPWIICMAKKLVYFDPQNKWLKLYFDIVKFHDGRTGRYNRVVEGSTGKGVVIIPQDARKRIGFVRIFRYPIGKWQWELPRGFAEKGLSTEENAKKELYEETGLHAKRFIKVGELFPNSGVLATKISIFLAQELPFPNKKCDLEDSISDIDFFTIDEIDTMTARGELTDGITLSALYIAQSCGMI